MDSTEPKPSTSKVKRDPNFLCPLSCLKRYLTRDKLRNHLKDDHGVNMEKQHVNFKSYDDFLHWKEGMEKEQNSLYHRRRGLSKLASQAKTCYYYCHRSSFTNDENNDPNKIDGYCPSSIDVYATEDEVEITFWKTHCGHTNSVISCAQTREHNIVEGEELVSCDSGKSKCGLKCPALNCCESFHNRQKLRAHIEQKHSVALEVHRENFSSFEDFELWKTQMEKMTKCLYFRSSAPKSLKSKEAKTIHYYACHRSGFFKSISTGKKSLKSQGSKKINGCCPSSIDVTETNGQVTIEFWKTHFGHDMELCHLNLTVEEKNAIACKLKQGISFERVLDDVRSSVDKSELKRIHLLNKQDLKNIRRDFQVLNNERLHPDDATSVHLWVKSMELAKDSSPVVFYKEQGAVDPAARLKDHDFQLEATKVQNSLTLSTTSNLKNKILLLQTELTSCQNELDGMSVDEQKELEDLTNKFLLFSNKRRKGTYGESRKESATKIKKQRFYSTKKN